MITLKQIIVQFRIQLQFQLTIIDIDISICFVRVGVRCFSKFLHVVGMVAVPDGKAHLIPENFSAVRNDRR